MRVCCIGDRPKNYPCLYDESHKWAKNVKSSIMCDLDVGWNSCQISSIILGPDLGFLTWCAEVALEVGIPIHVYVPFKGQESKWPTKAQDRYHDILSKAENVIYVAESYSNRAFFDRDKAMVDNCDLIFALLDPQNMDSGTGHTVQYAQKQNKEIENYWRD